mgnify:CR=1 FL=1
MAYKTADELRKEVAHIASNEEHSKDSAKYWKEVLPSNWQGPYPKEWCGAYALWCLHKGLNCELIWEFATSTKRESGFLHHLTMIRRGVEPNIGDIAYRDKPFQHHAVVTAAGIDADGIPFVITQDGNSGDPPGEVLEHWNEQKHWTCFYSIQELVEDAMSEQETTAVE